MSESTDSDPEMSGGGPDFEALYGEHRAGLMRLALRLTRRKDQAEDLVSETITRALEKYGSFRGEASFGTWIRKILVYLVYDLSASRRLEELPEEVRGRDSEGPERQAERGEIAARIDEALARISPSQRQVFLLREMEDLRHAQIASRLGMAEGTVKVHYFHALRRLREELHDLV